MWQQLVARAQRILNQSWVLMRPWLYRAFVSASALTRGPVLSAFKAVLHTLAALIVLFLEWGWQPLATALSAVIHFIGFKRLSAWLAGLPPYGALAMFVVPAVCLIPVKLFAVYLFATGHAAIGVGLIILAKVIGTAVVARIYMLTQPQLMEIGWFKSAHDKFMPWKDRMYAEIRSSQAWRTGRIVRVEIKRQTNRTWIGLKPQREWAANQFASLRAGLRNWLANLAKDLH